MEQKIAKVQQGESKSGKTVWSFRIPNSTNDYIELSTYGCSLQGLHVHDGDGTLRGLVREMGLQFKADSSASHKVDSDEMVAAIDRVLKACQKNNVIPGIVTATAEDAARRIKQGFQLVTCMNDLGFFCSRTKQHIQSVRELAARP